MQALGLVEKCIEFIKKKHMNRYFKFTLLLLLVQFLLAGNAQAQNEFYAYHTKVSHTSTDYLGKYADLIVVLGKDKQLEFTRQTNYTPKWVTPSGSFIVDEFFPEREKDYSIDYNYVRLLEESNEKITVHWRYMPSIDLMEEANANLEPTNIHGFTNVVHEIFTIYPSGKVERSVKDARGTLYDQWINPDKTFTQEIILKEDGIDHGLVDWGSSRKQVQIAVDKNPVITGKSPVAPSITLHFDEGGGDYNISDIMDWQDIREEIWGYTIESSHKKLVPVSGHGALYKKGVSGTALAFDGYYSGISFDENFPVNNSDISLEAWVALDAYPFNEAPIMHKSINFGEKGFYLGIDAYGHAFIRVNGSEVKADDEVSLYKWTHIAATITNKKMALFVDGELIGEASHNGSDYNVSSKLTVGINTDKKRCTDYVRGPKQNIPFIYGIQGLMDEVKLYNKTFSAEEIQKLHIQYLPENRDSDLPKAVLPGEVGIAKNFGASYKTLSHQEIWDRMWRLSDFENIVVKFNNNPASIVYWHGANYAASYVTDNNRWMADQSSEIFTKHGCSEHMADKQGRHSYARVIENSDARVIIHWRYPCVDVAYICTDRRNWTDEYHTIYPDGTAIRKVVFNNDEPPGFQDIQFFTNPGETALDVVHQNAMTVANTRGDILELQWEKPNKNPEQKLKDATIEWLNSKSEYKVYAIYQGGEITTWGEFEQSQYTDDPFAGPWNHWPVSLLPSDGRFAVAHDRVTHFALGANDQAPMHGSMVHYGFTKNKIDSLIPLAKYWQNPPQLKKVVGGTSKGFAKEEKAYYFNDIESNSLSFSIEANSDSPLINPVLVLENCEVNSPEIKLNGKILKPGDRLKTGKEYDVNGIAKTVIWMKFTTSKPANIEITGL